MEIVGPLSILNAAEAERIIGFIRNRGIMDLIEVGCSPNMKLRFFLKSRSFALALKCDDMPPDVLRKWSRHVVKIFENDHILFRKNSQDKYSIISADICYLYNDTMILHEFALNQRRARAESALMVFTERRRGPTWIDIDFANSLTAIGMSPYIAIALSMKKGQG